MSPGYVPGQGRGTCGFVECFVSSGRSLEMFLNNSFSTETMLATCFILEDDVLLTMAQLYSENKKIEFPQQASNLRPSDY